MWLNRGEHIAAARRLRDLIADPLTDDARVGQVHGDVPADELAGFALGALSAAAGLS